MRCFTFLYLLTITALLSDCQAAPVPKRTNAKPAVLNAGNEKNIAGVLENVVWGARVGVRESKEISGLPIVRRQGKNWEAWLKKNLLVEKVKDTNLVRVSFQDGNAKEQAAIINGVVDYYLKSDVGSEREHLTKTLKSVKDSLEGGRQRGKLKPEQAADAEKAIKSLEENIQALPALVERAKAP